MADFTTHNGSRAFHASSAHLSPRGTRVYWAATALFQDAPDGQYEIEKLHSSHWSVTHTQAVNGGRDLVRRFVGWATTKGVAIRYAEIDHDQLAEKVSEKLAAS